MLACTQDAFLIETSPLQRRDEHRKRLFISRNVYKFLQVYTKLGKGLRISVRILNLFIIVPELDKQEIPLRNPVINSRNSGFVNKAFGAPAVFRMILHFNLRLHKQMEYLPDSRLGISGDIVVLHGGITGPKNSRHRCLPFCLTP